MSTTKDYVCLNKDGTLEHVTETRSYRNLTQDVADKLSSMSAKHIKRAFIHNNDICGLLASNAETFAYKFMKTLKLNSSFKIMEDKSLTPIFLAAAEKSNTYPQFIADWIVPATMKLMFAARIKYSPDASYVYSEPKNACLLIAWDSDKRPRRLPLPNLYDNCYMCMGQFEGQGSALSVAFGKACDQLDKSEWNSDLINADRQNHSDTVFRFKPSADGQGMSPLPVDGSWKNICPVASSAHIEILGGAL